MKYYGPERRTRQATIYDGKDSKCNNSDAQGAFRPIPGLGIVVSWYSSESDSDITFHPSG